MVDPDLLLEQDRADVDDSENVRVDDLPPRSRVVGTERSKEADPGTVDHEVERASLACLLERFCDRAVLADVCREGDDVRVRVARPAA